MSKPDIQRLIALQRMLLNFQAIDRKVTIPPHIDVAENDIEHSYSLAMLAWFLAPQLPNLNTDRILRLAMAHDLLEVYSGDTYAYGHADDIATKAEREHQAIQKLAQEWADFPELLASIDEYEARETAEARFIYALDKLQPAIMGYLNDGRSWHHLGITFAIFRDEKEKKIPISPEVTEYYHQFLDLLQQNSQLFPDEQKAPKTAP